MHVDEMEWVNTCGELEELRAENERMKGVDEAYFKLVGRCMTLDAENERLRVLLAEVVEPPTQRVNSSLHARIVAALATVSKTETVRDGAEHG